MGVRSAKGGDKAVEILNLPRGRLVVHLIGIEPLVYNAMSFKTMSELLNPSGRKSKAERLVKPKHLPYEEYVDSTYRRRSVEEGPTRLLMPCRSFKAALADVAKRVPGAPATTEVKQLTYVQGVYADLYGIPQIFMAPVRNSDMNRTPDIRTRAIVPEWCCTITVDYAQPQLNADTVTKLIFAAGQHNGVGDYRQQKGVGAFGQFRPVVDPADRKRFEEIMKYGSMAAQDDALQNPVPFDQETEALLDWYDEKISKIDSLGKTTTVGEEDADDEAAYAGNGHDTDDAMVEAAASRAKARTPRPRTRTIEV